MKYAYEDLSPEQFEDLIVFLCQCLFGISTQRFSTGTDGGRDAKFIGTAELFPSKAKPWAGTVIIQAKHTNGYNRSFSDPDFFSKSSQNTVVEKEIPRILQLQKQSQLDHYILFANRRLSGNKESEIQEHLSRTCKMAKSSIYLCGLEQLELWLKHFPEVSKKANLDLVDSPLIVSSDDLAEVIEALAQKKEEISTFIGDHPTKRVSYEEKNKINNMSEEYGKRIRKHYLKETKQIQQFLASPENSKILEKYRSTIDEFQMKIIANRKDYQTFDKVMEYLFDLLFNRDQVLKGHKRLTRTMVFFMYWNCDIGESEDA